MKKNVPRSVNYNPKLDYSENVQNVVSKTKCGSISGGNRRVMAKLYTLRAEM